VPTLNGQVIKWPITIHCRLIRDCVPFLSPLTTRRDYGGSILTRLHTGLTDFFLSEVRTESRFHFVVVTLCDSCGVRTVSRFHFVVVTLCDSCEVRTESRFHFVLVRLCDSCEVRTESSFHFVVVTLCDSCEIRTEYFFNPLLFASCTDTVKLLEA
jgi:hypothetical protein